MLLIFISEIIDYPPQNFEEKLYFFCVSAQIYTSAFIRSSNWILVIERVTSTLKRKVYEQWHNYYISIGICTIIIAYGSIVKNISYIIDGFEENYYTFSIAFDFITILISIYLWYINIKLRRLTVIGTKNLSEKFQINENICLIKFTLPFIISYIIINTAFNFLLDFGGTLISDEDLILAYNDFCVFFAYLIIFLYVLIKNKFIKCFYHNDNRETVSLTRTLKNIENTQNNVTGKTDLNSKQSQKNVKSIKINGKNIPTNFNNETYYRIITKSW
ncbi:Hypothetical protein SRAE_2000462000 [Strongyloides ratti]|uniref:7TM GPCR, serpentine receptor class e (Sre) family-containing protein n=1 Tax=Strongyloides ratti TaxID=34506 RepID=A0A090LP53_STRRB|nr:Hypothetical protein SRAE_2000462000 [Strongyloides ratti]CEF69974.1 Hypothetical protein SRAE_2000462000 [Strongyloides ratti]